jgi:hypothetical protein
MLIYSKSHKASIEYLGVVPEAQGKGLALGLISDAFSLSRTMGLSTLELWVEKDNRRARKLYDPAGRKFAPVNGSREFRYPNGTPGLELSFDLRQGRPLNNDGGESSRRSIFKDQVRPQAPPVPYADIIKHLSENGREVLQVISKDPNSAETFEGMLLNVIKGYNTVDKCALQGALRELDSELQVIGVQKGILTEGYIPFAVFQKHYNDAFEDGSWDKPQKKRPLPYEKKGVITPQLEEYAALKAEAFYLHCLRMEQSSNGDRYHFTVLDLGEPDGFPEKFIQWMEALDVETRRHYSFAGRFSYVKKPVHSDRVAVYSYDRWEYADRLDEIYGWKDKEKSVYVIGNGPL